MFKNSRCRAIAVAVIAAGLTVSFASHPLAGPGRDASIRNIVLVHGAWADGSSWARVIPLLQARGFNVVAAQLPLTSLADDTAAVKRAIDRMTSEHPGPVVLVGHSYGGAVIGEAGTDPRVAALVYVAAFAPDQGESALGLLSAYPTPAPLGVHLSVDASGFFTIDPAGVEDDFAQCLSSNEREILAATQGPNQSRLSPRRPSPLRGKRNLAGTSLPVTIDRFPQVWRNRWPREWVPGRLR
jgi:pimeloyl-ACP methyl ester carboxylesterase